MEEVKVVKKSFFSKEFPLTILIASILIFLAIGLAVGYTVHKASLPVSGSTGLCTLTGEENQGTATEALTLTKEELSQKVQDYLNENFLSQQDAEAKLLGVEEFAEGVYLLNFDIYQNEEKVEESQVYATEDGEHIFLVEVDLSEPIASPQVSEPEPQEFMKTEKPTLHLFVMTFCPYGQVAEEFVKPVVELLGEKITFEPHFIFYDNYCDSLANYYEVRMGLDSEEKWLEAMQMTKEEFIEDCKPKYCVEGQTYCSMHGLGELMEGVRQRCILMDEADKAKWYDYVSHINENCSSENVDSCWEQAAAEVGLNIDEIKSCAENQLMTILESEFTLAKDFDVQGSPTIIINGTPYAGKRTSEDLKAALCSAFETLPEECTQELSGNAANTPEGGCGA